MKTLDRKIPCNNLPPLPPKVNLDTVPILRKTITASRVLANLNGAITNLPNPRLFIDTIHLQEAKGSSEIENILTTNDDLYQFAIADRKEQDPAAKEVVNYKNALWSGLKQLESKPFITTNLCIEIMQQIKQNTSSIRVTPGTTLSNTKGEIICTPPSGEDVIRKKMGDLEQFINTESSLDPLIKMALMHYQFEAIHPFADGNGRTGRIMLLLYLKMEKLLDVPAIYLSEYIIENKATYYKRLRAVTENQDWEGWVIYMLDMIENTAAKGLVRLQTITVLMQKISDEIKAELPKTHSKELMETLFRLPYTKRKHLVDYGLGNSKTVGNYLTTLEAKGFLRSVKVEKEKLYLNFRLMDVLET